MSLKIFSKKINLVLITHAFGVQTQYIESLLDGHTETIQFPTNYKDYFLNLKSKNFKQGIEEFIAGNPGYVYDIFNKHKNKYLIKDNSRVVPLIKDRDCFYFDKNSLKKILSNDSLKIYYNFIKKNINRKFKKKFLFEKELKKKFKELDNLSLLLETANSPYSLNEKKFRKIYLNVIYAKDFDMKFNKKNFLIILHYCLCLYLKKNIKKIKYIIFNLHDYTNFEELLKDFKNGYHIAVGEDFKIRFSRNKNKIISQNESVVQYSYSNLINIDGFLKSLILKKKRNYLFFNSFINYDKKNFIVKIAKILKIKTEKKLFLPTFLGKKSYGNSRNMKLLSKGISDQQYFDWWNYLSKKEIFFLDLYFSSFFQIFKIQPSKSYFINKKKIFNFKNFLFSYIFILQDYKYFIQNELSTQRQISESNLKKISFFSILRTPIKILIYTIFYPIVFSKKLLKIVFINRKFKEKKFKMKIFKLS